MKIIRNLEFQGKQTAVCIGKFDGIHRGHRLLIEQAKKENKPIVMISFSVDEAKDKQKWLDFIKKEELGGIQVHASGWSKIAQDYKIKGIPRFMVFDKQGRVVSVDATRPS